MWGIYRCKLIVRLVLSLFVLHAKKGPTGPANDELSVGDWGARSPSLYAKKALVQGAKPPEALRSWTKCFMRELNFYAKFNFTEGSAESD